MLQLEQLLERCVRMDGSDLHIKTDTGKVYVRVYGDLIPLDDVPHFEEPEFRESLARLLSEKQIARFQRDLELDFAIETYQRLLDRTTDPSQREAVTTALGALRGWRF